MKIILSCSMTHEIFRVIFPLLLVLVFIFSNIRQISEIYRLDNYDDSTLETQIVTNPSAPKHTPYLAYLGSDGEYHITRENVSYESDKSFADFLLFVRISKTSSTSMMNLLQNTGLISSNAFILEHRYEEMYISSLNCIYTQGNQFIQNNSNFFIEDDEHDCPHADYGYYMDVFLERLPYMNVPEHVYVHPFTIVRNPFDRLISFFYYMKEIIPYWTASEAQDKLILDGDFPGWIEKLNEEFGTDAMEEDDPMAVPYQYEAIHSDLSTAIELTTGDDPEVLVLLSECTHLSMQLFAKKKPQFFSTEGVGKFLMSSKSEANKAKNFNRSSPNFNVTRMRQIHKQYFPNDWKFYDEIVKQFKRDLQTSGIPSKDIQECLKKIGSDE